MGVYRTLACASVGNEVGEESKSRSKQANANSKSSATCCKAKCASRESTRNQAIPQITASRGRVVKPFAIRVAGTDKWRIIFALDAEGAAPVDLRAFLRSKDGTALSETWLFQHFPQQQSW